MAPSQIPEQDAVLLQQPFKPGQLGLQTGLYTGEMLIQQPLMYTSGYTPMYTQIPPQQMQIPLTQIPTMVTAGINPAYTVPAYHGSEDIMMQCDTSSGEGSGFSSPIPGDLKADSKDLRPFWEGIFRQHLPEDWLTLKPIHEFHGDAGLFYGDASIFKKVEIQAKVRFRCGEEFCGNDWTSKTGQVTFYYAHDPHSQLWHVYFELFGAVCKKCYDNRSENTEILFEPPLWYDKQIVKSVEQFKNTIMADVYKQPVNKPQRVQRTEQPQEEYHRRELCQACLVGRCMHTCTSQ